MRRAACVVMLLALCAIFAVPAAAQSEQDRWVLNAQIGPSFGSLGTTPNFDASAGYRFTDRLSLIGEFGVLSHAPFEEASSIAPPVSVPSEFRNPEFHVNGYHYNANLIVTPRNWGQITPYATVGFGGFTGSTVARYGGLRKYESAANFATNVGGGVSYRLNRWFGVNADYRHFFVSADELENVDRFTTRFSIFLK